MPESVSTRTEWTAVVRALLALGAVAATVAVLVPRVVEAVGQLDTKASAQSQRLAQTQSPDQIAEDSLDVDNSFSGAALSIVPADGRYAVLLPSDAALAQQTYGVQPDTLQGLADFMRFLLLPRRDVDPLHHVRPAVPVGGYVLCYFCDTSPWDRRTHWLWNDQAGLAIGRVYR